MKYEVRKPTGELLGTLRGPQLAHGQRYVSFNVLAKLPPIVPNSRAQCTLTSPMAINFDVDYWRFRDGREIPMLVYGGKVSHLSKIQGFWRA